jgi:hypothetical protein
VGLNARLASKALPVTHKGKVPALPRLESGLSVFHWEGREESEEARVSEAYRVISRIIKF